MPQTREVKLFKNGASQAVRLPAEFRFKGDHVYATRDDVTGDVTLSDRPGAAHWQKFFDTYRGFEAQDDFMSERPGNEPPPAESVFDRD